MCCYLIHFHNSPNHMRHYIGYTTTAVDDRIKRHRQNSGARFMTKANELGLKWVHVRTWDDATFDDEKKLKGLKGAAKLCPICNPERWDKNGNLESGSAS